MRIAAAPDGNFRFYDRTALWWGAATISEQDRRRAATIDAVAPGPLQVLELGAGFGGAAAATADLGHSVIAIERSPVRAAFARKQVWTRRCGELQVLEGNFYEVELRQSFDVVAYWSGFGVGDDESQLQLLMRIAQWIGPAGCALVDVFDPCWWSAADGCTREIHEVVQRLGFDMETSRCSITYSLLRNSHSPITETIRCYRPDEFAALARRAGLVPSESIEAHVASAPSYLAKLKVAQ